MCESVHVDRFDVGEQNPSNTASPFVESPRSLIKGGVTRASTLPLAGTVRGKRTICWGDFYKRGSPRGLVYLFRRRRRGRGGRPGGIRAISKGGRNTAIFIRAAGMQSRSGAGVGGRSGGRRRPFWGQLFLFVFRAGCVVGGSAPCANCGGNEGARLDSLTLLNSLAIDCLIDLSLIEVRWSGEWQAWLGDVNKRRCRERDRARRAETSTLAQIELRGEWLGATGRHHWPTRRALHCDVCTLLQGGFTWINLLLNDPIICLSILYRT